MGIQTSVTVGNARLDAAESSIGTSPHYNIYAGAAMPADCATAVAGTKVLDIPCPSDWMNNASARAKTKLGTWASTVIVAGKARYWRIYDAASSVCHMQGLCSEPWAASKAYALNMHVNNGGNVYLSTTAGTSAGSGGPSGTGTGITDGSAVWAYVGTADLILDNTDFALSQAVAISTFTLNDGNA